MLDEGVVSDSETSDAATDARVGSRHRSPAAVIAAVAVVALAAVGAVGWFARGRDSDTSVAVPRFVEEATSAGVDHRYEGGFDYFVGGGVAVFDCDGDAMPELYFAGGAAPAALYRNESVEAGALRFAPEPSPVTDLSGVTGAYPINIDSDGFTDLVVLRNAAPDQVLRGVGDCRFEVDDRLDMAADASRTTAFSATWEGTNELPTLAFGNYLVADTTDCAPSELIRPDESGGYSPPVDFATHCALSVLFTDWNRTGQRDLRVSNDRHYYVDGSEQMWRIEPGVEPTEYAADDGWRELRIWGMGIASQDLTGDGRPEVYLTSQGDNKLQTLDEGATVPAYHDIALDRGVTAQRPVIGGDVLPSTAWHPEFDDVNNDGFADLFITKGNVEAQPDYASRDPNDLFMGRADGTFISGSEDAGITRFERSRGAAVADLNLDGLLDVVVVNREANVELWRNVGSGDGDHPAPMGHWLAVTLTQPAPNVDAVGAWIEARAGGRTTSREVTIGGGHAGGQSGPIHLGLGDAPVAEVRVQWPDGEVGPWMTVDADQHVVIDRAAATPAAFDR